MCTEVTCSPAVASHAAKERAQAVHPARSHQPAHQPCQPQPQPPRRTTVCASTPLMKMGSGRRPAASISSMSCGMYGCSVITCLRYNRMPTAVPYEQGDSGSEGGLAGSENHT